MNHQRTIEIFSAGCPLCDEVISAVRSEARPSCHVIVSDLRNTATAERTRDRFLQYRLRPELVAWGEL